MQRHLSTAFMTVSGILLPGLPVDLDLGRPDDVQLIFDRRMTKRTPGRFRTRVVTEGVLPSLDVDYRSSRLKQYFQGRPGVAHRDGHQQRHLRLRYRPPAGESPGLAGAWLYRQPTSLGRPTRQPGLPGGRRRVSRGDVAATGGDATRVGVALWQRVGAAMVAVAAVVSSAAVRFWQPGVARASGTPAGSRPRDMHRTWSAPWSSTPPRRTFDPKT
jgi:hypothetical protein